MAAFAISRRALLQAAAALAMQRAAHGQQGFPRPADFLESIGVCTHLSSEPYASRFDQVKELLRRLGIRYLRDELRPTNDLARWAELYADQRIRSHLLVSPATNTVPEMLEYIRSLGSEKLSAIEGQNEGDSPWFVSQPAAGGDWAATVVAYQREVFAALRSHYGAAELPVVSPSVLDWKPADMRTIRAAADYCDFVAIHSYAQHGEMPETDAPYAALSWYLREMRDPFKPGAPVMATETGYNTLTGGQRAVSETAAAVYLPRLLLFNFAAGVRRTFLYELFDGGEDPKDSEDHWGLVHFDGTPKPAFYALEALFGAFSGAAAAGEPVRLTPRSAPSDLHLVHFAAPGGGTLAALWRAVSVWNPSTRTDISAPAENVVLVPDRPLVRSEIMRPNVDATWRSLDAAETLSLDIDGRVVLLRLSA